MKYFRDIKTREAFSIEDKNAESFQDEYENPQNLLCVNCWYCDGSGWNGKRSAYSYYLDKDNNAIIQTNKNKSNNEMEYMGMILCCEKAEEYDIIKSDSKLVVNQINKEWKCNFEHLRSLKQVACLLVKKKNLKLLWIPREENMAGKMFEEIAKALRRKGK